LARTLSGQSPTQLVQRDVFFCTPRGRLKLRSQSDGRAFLVYYERPDESGPRSSVYEVAPCHDAASLERTLSAALGVRGEVRKHRALYLVGSTRIHIDEVQGLGCFLELEAMLGAQQTSEVGRATVSRLMDELGISHKDLVDVAYIDLLERQASKESERECVSH
jgi:predicted adenylyl cyclase CyaB